MPHKPQKAKKADGKYNVVVTIPGWLKNQLIDHCKKQGTSLNTWIGNVLYKAVQAEQGLPEPPPARAPLPTTADQIRAWAAGERIVYPCGRTECEVTPQTVNGITYCANCRIRIS